MTPNAKVAFHTFGCKLNFSETSTISRQFEDAGYAKVPFADSADVYVINTCSVTENADKKCAQLVREINGRNPHAQIVITGCYAQLKPKEIIDIKGVNLVVGANDKFDIIQHLANQESTSSKNVINGEIKEVKKFVPAYSVGDRTRSFFKVQDGCDYFCSFCTIPLARGTSRNASITETIKKAQEVAGQNIKEIVLTGVNIGDFGKSTGENFLDLIKGLEQVEGIDRFRISSIEPNLLSNEIISFVASSKKFVPHFHIPLQCGNDYLLKKMRRRYVASLYKERVEYIKTLMPHCAIGVDVIVGFPEETAERFQETYDFIASLDVSYLHVFPYSERSNTTAVRMEGVIPVPERQKRSKLLQQLSTQKKKNFYQNFMGQTRAVLFEDQNEEGYMHGFTDNYLRVKSPYDAQKVNTITQITLNKISDFIFVSE